MSRRILYSLFALTAMTFVFLQNATAQNNFMNRYNATFVTMNDGLTNDFIDDIYKDSHGFVWLATGGGGLVRYDGHNFIEFSSNTHYARLKSNFIIRVCEDKHDRLWIITDNGLDILDINRLRISQLSDTHGIIDKIRRSYCSCVTRDARGCIWVKAGTSLFRISFNDDGSVRNADEYRDRCLAPNDIICKDVDGDGTVWVAMAGRFYKVGGQPGSKLKAHTINGQMNIGDNVFVSDYETKENEVWISTDRGLLRYNKNTGGYKHYTHVEGDPTSLSQDFLTGMTITHDKQLLVASLKGLNVYNPITDSFEWICDATRQDGSRLLNSNFINCITEYDRQIWVGTESGGLNKLSPKRLDIHNYIYDPNNNLSLAKNQVNAVYEDSYHRLWVGTVESGLSCKMPGTDDFIHYTQENSGLSHNSVSAITADHTGRLWVGTWGGGISIYDLQTPKHIIGILSPETGAPVSFIGALICDSINNGMWIGANKGIYFYNLDTGQFTPIQPQATGCIGVCIDNKNRLWMGSMEGVYIIDLNEFKKKQRKTAIQHLRYKLDNPESGLIERITCIYMSNSGTIWIGSNGNGLYKVTDDKDDNFRFCVYNRDKGLPNSCIKGILEDEYGRLWVSTGNGLSYFIPEKERFVNYTKHDGLVSPNFYWNAFCRATDGQLYFGTTNGLVAITPPHSIVKSGTTHLCFTSLCISDSIIRSGSKVSAYDISASKEISLHESDKSFSLEFSNLNYEDNGEGTYSYRLLGFNDKWVVLPDGHRFINYTNLSAGNYTLQVRYTKINGEDAPEIAELQIHISPYFYKTWWFILLMLSLLAVCVWQFYQWRIRNLKAQRLLLHQKVEQRTRELEEQKSKMAQMAQKVQQLTIDKISFFTNITHEFRTPITLIIGPIERALKLSYNPQVIEQLRFVERNSRYLLSLINQLMDFRKLESGKLEIMKTRHNIIKFTEEVVIPFVVFAQDRDIEIRRFYRTLPELCYDEEAMQKVLTNLLSNALKFTPDHGTVSIYVALLKNKTGGGKVLYVCISDTGCGIPENDLNKIFGRFYQSQNQVRYPMYGQSGSGIGLYLCQQIVQALGGNIIAKNNHRNGCSMRITIPIADNDTGTDGVAEQGVTKDSRQPVAVETDKDFTILVVEDNRDMRSFIRSILRDHYNVEEASNGQEAWNILLNKNIDFIISDFIMPVMDGLELSRRVKENFAVSHIPFLMLTAKTSPQTRLESYKMGVDEYLLKPFDETLLLARIDNILENRKRYQRRFGDGMNINDLNMPEESGDKKFINKVMEIMKENYKNSYFKLDDFSEIIGISKSLLNKKLQSLIGQSTGQFICCYRLNMARELILKNRVTHSMNISEIAYEVGFNDPKYFTRCFTRHFNITPSALLNDGDKYS